MGSSPEDWSQPEEMANNVTVGNETANWNDSQVSTSVLFILVDLLDLYYVPTIIVMGLVGNLISFAIFIFSVLKKLSLSVYLATLAVSDCLFLLSLAVVWTDHSGLGLFHRPGWCQVTVYVSYVCSFLSVWCIVSYTIERYIAICHPMLCTKMCTTGRARIVVVGLCTTSLSIYACSLRISGMALYEEGELCTPYLSPDYYPVHLALTYADTVVSFFVPFFVILVFNVLIFRKIRFFYNQENEHVPIASLQHCPPHCHRHPNASEICQHNQAQVKVTKSMFIMSTMFLIISLPSYVIRVWVFVADLLLGGFRSSLQDALLQQLCQCLFYLNYCINIVLYLVCWSKFRRICYEVVSSSKRRICRWLSWKHDVRLPQHDVGLFRGDIMLN
ncbi:hypothetical protein LSH36_87g01024 [Paralvinella palmiformis]|uniref:G-protein coupled receptors family 1 profile domain-containing protein n=1 Tax=Paralvinella palmiformis TaxID=53620 RepID=A0AAD9K136_9ANNE|nr:hypothetical protein LSH36_87g01024 [Paralvinella palmiformis]